MIDAYEGQLRVCRKCISQVDHMTELERRRTVERFQRTVMERSQLLTHRAMQIGQVVGGSIGGLATAGLNFGVGVGSGVYDSARALTMPMRHIMPQRVQDIEDSQLGDNVQETRAGYAEIIR